MKNTDLFDLPEEMLLKILKHWHKSVHYDLKSLFRLMPVCKLFYSYLTTDEFLLSHKEGAGAFPYNTIPSLSSVIPCGQTAYTKLCSMAEQPEFGFSRNEYLNILSAAQYFYLTPKNVQHEERSKELYKRVEDRDPSKSCDHLKEYATQLALMSTYTAESIKVLEGLGPVKINRIMGPVRINRIIAPFANQNLAYALLRASGGFLQHLPFARDNETLVKTALTAPGMEYYFSNPPGSGLSTRSEGDRLKFASPRLKNNKDIIIYAMQSDGMSLASAPASFQSKIEVVKAAVKNNGNAIRLADQKYTESESIASIATQNVPYLYRALPSQHAMSFFPSFSNNKKIIRQAAIKNPDALSFASSELKNDIELVYEIVSHWGEALEYADPLLQNNPKIAEQALKRCFEVYGNGSRAISALGEDLLKDLDFMKRAAKIDGNVIERAHEDIKYEKELVSIALNYDGMLLQELPEERITEDYCSIAIKRQPLAIYHAPDSFKQNLDLAKLCLRHWKSDIRPIFLAGLLPEEMQKNKDAFLLQCAYSASAAESWKERDLFEAPIRVFAPPLVLFSHDEAFPTLKELAAQSLAKTAVCVKREELSIPEIKNSMARFQLERGIFALIKEKLQNFVMGSHSPLSTEYKVCLGHVNDILWEESEETKQKLANMIANTSSKVLYLFSQVLGNHKVLKDCMQQAEKVIAFNTALSMQSISETDKESAEEFFNHIGQSVPENAQIIDLKYRQLRDSLSIDSDSSEWCLDPKFSW